METSAAMGGGKSAAVGLRIGGEIDGEFKGGRGKERGQVEIGNGIAGRTFRSDYSVDMFFLPIHPYPIPGD